MQAKQIIFFVFISLFYTFMLVATNQLTKTSPTLSVTSIMIYIFSAMVFLLAIFGYIEVAKLFPESYHYQTSPGKLCQGGAYMMQGNSTRAKMCRQMASTQAGKDEISRYNCGVGYHGMPGGGFKYTPISNDCWENERCNNPSSCDIDANGIF
jgi:hypothetical protein